MATEQQLINLSNVFGGAIDSYRKFGSPTKQNSAILKVINKLVIGEELDDKEIEIAESKVLYKGIKWDEAAFAKTCKKKRFLFAL